MKVEAVEFKNKISIFKTENLIKMEVFLCRSISLFRRLTKSLTTSTPTRLCHSNDTQNKTTFWFLNLPRF